MTASRPGLCPATNGTNSRTVDAFRPYGGGPCQDPGFGQALGADFFSVREQFTPEQWSAFTAVRRFVDTEVIPVAGDYWERAELRDITGIGAFA
jgi:hypothetical protein